MCLNDFSVKRMNLGQSNPRIQIYCAHMLSIVWRSQQFEHIALLLSLPEQ